MGHFRVPMVEGLKIIQEMRGHSSGLEIPEYVIDLPNGLGKVPVAEGVSIENGLWEITTWSGERVTDTKNDCSPWTHCHSESLFQHTVCIDNQAVSFGLGQEYGHIICDGHRRPPRTQTIHSSAHCRTQICYRRGVNHRDNLW